MFLWGQFAWIGNSNRIIWLENVIGATPPQVGDTQAIYESRMQSTIGNNPSVQNYGGYSAALLLAWGFEPLGSEASPLPSSSIQQGLTLHTQDYVIRVNTLIDQAFKLYGGFTAPVNMPVYKPADWSFNPPSTPTKYALNVDVFPASSGQVSGGGGYPLPNMVNSGDTVTINAVPSSGYQFDHWGGDASGTSPTISLTMNSNKHITLYFKLVPATVYYHLTIQSTPGGSTSQVSEDFEKGTQVTITAQPDDGYTFNGWSGDVSSTSATIVIAMDSNKSVTANFRAKPPTPTPSPVQAKSIWPKVAIGTGVALLLFGLVRKKR